MNQNDLEILLKDMQALPKECEWAEFKVNNSNPEEIGEYLSALSNSACYDDQEYGFLVFGIENETHRFVGTSFRPLNYKRGNEELENWLAVNLDPRVDFRIFELDYESRHFAIFRIEATRLQPVAFKGKSYIRVGSYKKPLNAHPERERKIWNKTNTVVFEKTPAIDRITEEEVLNLLDYSKFFQLIKYPLPDNRKGIIEKLIQEKVIESVDELYMINNLGALLLGKELSEFEAISRKAIRVIHYEGKNRAKTKKEQLGRYGYAIAFEGLISYILDQLPSNEVIGQALRKVVTVYPALAIRELVANAIIHQDFSISGSSAMVEIFDNRIEITNPGKPLIDPLRFVDHSPQSRNELLARFMRRVNICEERGSGIDKVVLECELHQLPAPNFIDGENYTRVILYAPTVLSQMDKNDKIRACYQHACLKYVSGEQMTNQTLRDRFGIKEQNYSMVSRIIGDAKKEGLIKDYDPTSKSKTYAKYLPFWA